ncbi:mechanosensitive ion channel family protein [Desulfovibrio oxyclinae]|jgi:small-conductance mechanosensitive channel|uniref:mechanosensitive ion channel family protein n=1 Tax=Desulfovibrio oxyclinae TaxID=63560 RepID=UPI0003661CC8|nr:mechanosensitive ion channel domain-containing protein [Desulfovibrio oxyclinae]
MESVELIRLSARIALASATLIAAAGILIWLFRGRTPGTVRFRDALLDSLRSRTRMLIPAAAVIFAVGVLVPLAQLDEAASKTISTILNILWIMFAAWGVTAVVSIFCDVTLWRYDVNVEDNLGARQVHTRVRVLQRIVVVVVWIVAVAGALMLFERFRALGGTLLASAGVLSILLGLSAQKTFGAMVAGIQVALSHPVNIDDVVIVEGEWGRIEEITFTYVVVRTWDLRRIILPISYFLETPFQNWTRKSAEILGSVFLHADYTVPMDQLREELRRLCEANSGLWNGKTCVLQVTDAGPDTVTLRALVSADNAGAAWDLRCIVREGLIGYINEKCPQCLPRHRVRLQDEAGATAEPLEESS